MCRLTVYKGKELLLGDLIVKPENSLVCQSRDAAYHPGVVDKSHVRNIRVNGDGFGVAFYGSIPEVGSCLFRFVTPAWSNKNLINLGGYVHSTLIMGHIRAATSGVDPLEPQSVSIENCHPFKYGRWTFMHNGGIPRFSKIKLSLLNLLTEECFQHIDGSTDSEHIFALFLSFLPDRDSFLDSTIIAATLEKTIGTILRLCKDAGVVEPCSLNICVTDGIHVLATRFRNGKDAPPSLYYNYGSQFISSEGTFLYPGDEHSCEIVISSAPLCKDFYIEDIDDSKDVDCGNWILVPKNTMLVCVGDKDDNSKINEIYLSPIVTKCYEKPDFKRPSYTTSSIHPNHRINEKCTQTGLKDTQAVFPSPKSSLGLPSLLNQHGRLPLSPVFPNNPSNLMTSSSLSRPTSPHSSRVGLDKPMQIPQHEVRTADRAISESSDDSTTTTESRQVVVSSSSLIDNNKCPINETITLYTTKITSTSSKQNDPISLESTNIHTLSTPEVPITQTTTASTSILIESTKMRSPSSPKYDTTNNINSTTTSTTASPRDSIHRKIYPPKTVSPSVTTRKERSDKASINNSLENLRMKRELSLNNLCAYNNTISRRRESQNLHECYDIRYSTTAAVTTAAATATSHMGSMSDNDSNMSSPAKLTSIEHHHHYQTTTASNKSMTKSTSDRFTMTCDIIVKLSQLGLNTMILFTLLYIVYLLKSSSSTNNTCHQ